MKTLIINGSPRKNGDTQALIDAFCQGVAGEVRILSEKDNISPCTDCRRCWKTPGCSMGDGMQEIYEYLSDCDTVVLASPVWFSSLSGVALNIGSRFQMYFAGKFFRKEPSPFAAKPKNGVILLCGAQPGTETAPIGNAKTILRLAGVTNDRMTVHTSMNTDRIPAKDDAATLQSIRKTAERLNAEAENCQL
ncbi:MAG: flavodoxin family protein [Clostridia bacterium]|nr:flavodoxin family protein [Clostridia bacterium]